MVAFPVAVIFFFTSLLSSGQPQEMPVGIVDLDNTSTPRALIRKLDGFQSSEVVAYYSTPAEAREAIMRYTDSCISPRVRRKNFLPVDSPRYPSTIR